MIYNSIAILGFRATGKSSVGSVLAKNLGWSFIELDKQIQTDTGKTIAELTSNGTNWQNFRSLELEMLNKALKNEKIVISCGGGVGVNDQNRDQQQELLKSFGDCLKILLWADTEVIKSRLLQDFRNLDVNHRVSLTGQVETEEMFWQNNLETLNKRRRLYEMLTEYKFDTSADSIDSIVDKILNQFKHELFR